MSDHAVPFEKPQKRVAPPPSQADFFTHCRLRIDDQAFDVAGLAALTADFGGTRLSEVPVDRWRELMAEGTRRSLPPRTETIPHEMDTDMTLQTFTADPILLLAAVREASYIAGNAAETDEASDPHFAKLWTTGLAIMKGHAMSIEGVAEQLRVIAYHLHLHDRAHRVTPPAELGGLTNAIDALTALRMKAAS